MNGVDATEVSGATIGFNLAACAHHGRLLRQGETTYMQKHNFLRIVLTLTFITGTMNLAVAQGTGSPLLSPPDYPRIDDEIAMLDGEDGGPDLRIVVAAPRATILGRTAGVLPVSRHNRRIDVEQGETARFISGIREAVWYAGRGHVESHLTLLRLAANQPPVHLGDDTLRIRGGAPRIAHGKSRVDVTFEDLGDIELMSVVKVAAKPRDGRPAARGRRTRYRVVVWPVGTLGEISGFVSNESDGMPLPGLRVLALDALSMEPVATALTHGDGSYLIRRLPPGDYLVGVAGRSGFESEFYNDAQDPAVAAVVTVSQGSEAAGIDFLLTRP
jgi:hypothetical protein